MDIDEQPVKPSRLSTPGRPIHSPTQLSCARAFGRTGGMSHGVRSKCSGIPVPCYLFVARGDTTHQPNDLPSRLDKSEIDNDRPDTSLAQDDELKGTRPLVRMSIFVCKSTKILFLHPTSGNEVPSSECRRKTLTLAQRGVDRAARTTSHHHNSLNAHRRPYHQERDIISSYPH